MNFVSQTLLPGPVGKLTGAPLGRVRVTWSGERGAKLSQCPPLHDSGVCKWLTRSLHTQFGRDETFITLRSFQGWTFVKSFSKRLKQEQADVQDDPEATSQL